MSTSTEPGSGVQCCTLPPDAQAQRAAEWAALRADALVDERLGDSQHVATFRRDAVERVRALVEAERRCCPSLDLAVRIEGDFVHLTIGFPAGAEPLADVILGHTSGDVTAAVRERYRSLALLAASGDTAQARPREASCGDGGASCCGAEVAVFGGDLYGEEADGASGAAVQASLGCGVPTAVADLHPGEVVLDLGSGAGADVLISARRVAPTGKVYGLDFTEEMLALARRNQQEAGIDNVEWLRGEIEAIPLPDASVDVVISNCVINLSADKAQVLREAARVLRPGGRFAVSDVVADPDMDAATSADMQAWTGCVAGALTREEFERHLRDAGLVDIAITETHRVHAHAASAIVRATKPRR